MLYVQGGSPPTSAGNETNASVSPALGYAFVALSPMPPAAALLFLALDPNDAPLFFAITELAVTQMLLIIGFFIFLIVGLAQGWYSPLSSDIECVWTLQMYNECVHAVFGWSAWIVIVVVFLALAAVHAGSIQCECELWPGPHRDYRSPHQGNSRPGVA